MARDRDDKPKTEPKPAKKFCVYFKAPPYLGRIENLKATIQKGENVIEDRDDAILLLAHPGMARFRALDAVEAGLVSMAELKYLGYDVPIDVQPVVVKVPGIARRCPVFSGLPAQERQEWAERLNIAVPAKEPIEVQSEILERAWRLHYGGN